MKRFIKKIQNPFITPKLKDKESLHKTLKEMFVEKEVENIEELANQDSIYLSEKGELVLFMRGKNGENIGGYKFDIINKDYESAILIENSYQYPVLINGINKDENFILVTDYLLEAIGTSQAYNTIYLDNLDNIDLLEKFIINENIKKEIIISPCKDEEKIKDKTFLENVKKLQERFPELKIHVERILNKQEYNEFLNDAYIKKPFIKNEVGDNNELYKFLLGNTLVTKDTLVDLFKENHIYQDVDRNMVFLVKDDMGKDIGGYSLNIYEESRFPKLLENSYIPGKNNDEIQNFINYICKALEPKEKEFLELGL